MSDVESETEKAERLAAAKKRYEELKKKNKKKGKKKNKDKEEDDAKNEIENIEAEANSDEKEKEGDAGVVDKDEAEKDVDVAKDTKEEEEEEDRDDLTIEERAELQIEKATLEESSKPKDESREEAVRPLKDSLEAEADEDDTASSGNTFELNKRIQELEQLNSITQLVKKELETKVTTLEDEILKLRQENAALRSQLDSHSHEQDLDDLDMSSPQLPPMPPIQKRGKHRPRVASFVEVDLYGEASRISDIRKQMEQWKGWQVDMRGWRSLGVGPAIDL